MADEGTPFHPLVAELLEDVEAQEGGPRISPERMRHWSRVFADRGDKQEIAVQLIVVAMRFRNHNAERAMQQVVVLAATLLGDVETRALLESQGLPRAEAQQIVGQAQAQGVSSPLAGGLAPPGGGVKRRG